jgi:hypothetical protein
MLSSRSWYLRLFSWILERPLSPAEQEEIWSKATGYHPVPYEDTWAAAIERIERYRQENPGFNPWRSQV